MQIKLFIYDILPNRINDKNSCSKLNFKKLVKKDNFLKNIFKFFMIAGMSLPNVQKTKNKQKIPKFRDI